MISIIFFYIIIWIFIFSKYCRYKTDTTYTFFRQYFVNNDWNIFVVHIFYIFIYVWNIIANKINPFSCCR